MKYMCSLVVFVFVTDMTVCESNVFRKCRVANHTSERAREYYADCSFRNLSSVPDDLPPNTVCLNMVGNKITTLSGKVWQRYKNLKKLSLAKNYIEAIDSGDFDGLSRLEMLDLSLNMIRYTDISEDAFRPLKALRFLDLKQNLSNVMVNETYPEALKHLLHLQSLALDGLGSNVLPYLPNLTELYMSGEYGRCDLPRIHGSLFKNVSGVQELFLSKCAIKEVQFNSFKTLENLTSLDVSWNVNLGMESVPNITSGLNGSKTFKRLNLNTLYDHSVFDFCSSINKDDIKYLKNTPIELITVENNNLVRMDIATVVQWPKSIKHISVSHNMFLYGNYTLKMILSGMLSNVTYLDIGHMAASNRPVNGDACADVSMEMGLCQEFQYCNRDSDQSSLTSSDFRSLCMSMFTRQKHPDYFQIIAERMKKHNIGSFASTNSTYGENKLEYLDISDNLPVLIERVFEIFNRVQNLKFLNVSKNYLGYPLYDETTIIGQMKNLRTLDLSDNRILRLMPNIFNNLTKLENLHLSHNKITNITFDLSGLNNLNYLDLEVNYLESINLPTRDILDKLPNIRINIADNNLKCICDNLDFLEWLERNKKKIVKLDGTRCIFKNSTMVSLASLNYGQLQIECANYLTAILVSSFTILLFIIIMSCALVYRYRWKLRYLYYMTKLKLASDYQRINDTEYEKEVFVSYANEDRGLVSQIVKSELEDKGEISLIIHDRDFLPGDYVADNIMRAISSSRRTLVILTRHFLKSKWCMYELNMARMEAIDRGRNVLCVILKEDISHKDLPLEVIEILKTKTYLEYPTAEDDFPEFWNRLRETLKHNV